MLVVGVALSTSLLAEEVTVLDEVVVTASRIEENADEVGVNLRVVSAEELTSLPAHDLVEALNYIEGVAVQRRGGFSQTGDSLSLEGCNWDQVRVMVDGVPLNGLWDNKGLVSQVPLESVERVEIIRGPASSVWGSSLGGVINVITRDVGEEEKPSVELSAAAGGWDTRKTSGNIRGRVGELGYLFSGSYLDSGGFRENSAVLEDKFFSKLEMPLGEYLSLSNSFGYTETDMGEYLNEWPGWLGPEYYLDHRQVLSRVAATTLAWRDGERFASVSSKFSQRTVDAESHETSGLIDTWDRSWSRELIQEVMLGRDTGMHRTVIGCERAAGSYRLEQHFADNDEFFGFELDLLNEQEATRWGGYLNYRLSIEPIAISIGNRYDDVEGAGSVYSPSASLACRFSETSVLRAAVSEGMHTPSFFTRFYEDPLPTFGQYPLVANPKLGPERVRHYSVGCELKSMGFLRESVYLYLADVRGAIEEVNDDERMLSYYKNLEKRRRQGVEFRLSTDAYRGISLYGGGAVNEVYDEDDNLMVPVGWESARRTYTGGMQYEGEDVRANLVGRYIWYGRFYDMWGDPMYPQDRKFVWDAKLVHSAGEALGGELQVEVLAKNIFNTVFSSDYLLPQPGSYVEGGLRLVF